MNVSLYIAKRYLRSASKSNAINIINWISSLGIIFGSAALFIVLSVFSGLIDFSLSFTNAIDPDLKATPVIGKSFTISQQQQQQLQKMEGISAFSKIAEERVLFVFDGKEQVAYIKGVDQDFTEVNAIKTSVFNGQWLAPETSQVVIGLGIAQKLSIGLFDANNALEVFVPRAGKGEIQRQDDAFNKTNLVPIGIYGISADLDSKYVFSDLDLAQQLLDFKPNQITGLEIKLLPNSDETKVISKMQSIFNNKLTIKNRAQLNDTLYKMLNTENMAVYLIFTLVIVIVLFNLVGALIMMILEKKTNLKTLYHLGVEAKDLRNIFLFQGTLLSAIGGFIGLLIGVVAVLVQQHFQIIMITSTLAYPVIFTIQNVVIVLTTIISLGFIASLIASSRVTKRLLE